LQIGITPMAVKQALKEDDYLNALTMAMKINEPNLIQEVIETIPVKDVQLIVSDLPNRFIARLLLIVASGLDSSRHLEYYLFWIQHTLTIHGSKISGQKNMPALLALEKSLLRRYGQISKLCDYNKYTLEYITTLGKVMSEKELKEEKMEDESEDSDDIDSNIDKNDHINLDDL